MIILSGGTGTPKLLVGIKKVFKEEELNIIVNTAEDVWISGNLVCPDIDSVLYALAGVIDKNTWWGIKDDSFYTYNTLKRLNHGEPMMIGDKDRATHIIRSELLREGKSLTETTAVLARSFGIHDKIRILPMTDEPAIVSTMILTSEGELHFQEFWVAQKGEPDVFDVTFEGIEKAKPSEAVIQVLEKESDALVLIGPSNPITSIGPILALRGIKELLRWKIVAAISPIIGTEAVSGPAGKFMRAKGFEVSPYGVLKYYEEFLDVLVIDKNDKCPVNTGVDVLKTDIMIKKDRDSKRLALFLKRNIMK
ncbi:MAG: 2-phospho-L-lactate transferase [Methanophagales archaeon]|nr:2-phospho-L-lactate transferase [Methanophagales archaeon]MCW3141379.1 2-phospho-L-lactate transferase [Methanophagales archaeon]